jgi:hypothetical protein
VGSVGAIVLQKSQAGRRPVGEPEVDVAVVVPVTAGNHAGVVVEIESAGRRSRGKLAISCVEKETIALVSTQRCAAIEQFINLVRAFEEECIRIGSEEGLRGFVRSDRHDLPPEETSQVIFALAGYEAVSDHEVFQAVVVDVSEYRTPGPAALARAGRQCGIAECFIAVVNEH